MVSGIVAYETKGTLNSAIFGLTIFAVNSAAKTEMAFTTKNAGNHRSIYRASNKINDHHATHQHQTSLWAQCRYTEISAIDPGVLSNSILWFSFRSSTWFIARAEQAFPGNIVSAKDVCITSCITETCIMNTHTHANTPKYHTCCRTSRSSSAWVPMNTPISLPHTHALLMHAVIHTVINAREAWPVDLLQDMQI
jgi:hypothetical protein